MADTTYKPLTILAGAAVAAAAILVAGTTLTVAPKKAEATAAFTQQTGLPCNKCHSAPPKLNEFGENFKKKGNKL
jgi:hypothetical protein